MCILAFGEIFVTLTTRFEDLNSITSDAKRTLALLNESPASA